MTEQIPLSLSQREHATFDNFYGAEERPAVVLLQQLISGNAPLLLYLWGGEGAGKSHLLHATCSGLEQQGERVLYLPLQSFAQYPPEAAAILLEGSKGCRLIVVEDLEQVVGNRDWEEQLFHLFNQARDRQQSLLVSAPQPLAELGVVLPDLRSRLGEAVIEYLPPLSGEEKWAVVQQRATERGMKIGDEVVHFLINRTPRDFHTLFELLDRLDQQTLAQQRKITIPFVKELLGI